MGWGCAGVMVQQLQGGSGPLNWTHLFSQQNIYIQPGKHQAMRFGYEVVVLVGAHFICRVINLQDFDVRWFHCVVCLFCVSLYHLNDCAQSGRELCSPVAM